MGTVYQFDVVSRYYIDSIVCEWKSSSKDNYFAIIPLEIGKVYIVTCQNITDLTKFQCVQSDSGSVGIADISYVTNDWSKSPTDGIYVSFVAQKDYLICTGGTTDGGELSVTSYSAVPVIGTKWKIHSTAMWSVVTQFFKIDGAFYEGDTVLTTLSSNNNIFMRTNLFGYGSELGTAAFSITPQPIVDNYYANERWRVYVEHGGVGSGFRMRDLTDTLYLEITGGEDAENPAFVGWLFGAGELVEEPTTATTITYGDETIATLEAGQTATIKTAETEVEHDIVITPAFPIEIAYGDIIATAGAGQTATIKTANTEADFDIVVSAKAEEDDSIVGTWVFNEALALPEIENVTNYWVDFVAVDNYGEQKNFVYFQFVPSSFSGVSLQYCFVSSGGGYAARTVYGTDGKWSNDASRTVKITGGDDVTNSEFITWLKANATKQ